MTTITPVKKIMVQKYLKKNLPKTIDNNDVNLIFTENGEFFINKIDGSLLKISDIVITNFVDMHNINNPSSEKLYICTDKKSIYMYTTQFELFIGGESEELKAVKKELADHISSFENYKQSTDNGINEFKNSLLQLSQSLSTLENDASLHFTQISESITKINDDIVKARESITENDKQIKTINDSLLEFTNSVDTINNNILSINKNIGTISTSIENMSLDIENIKKDILLINNKTNGIIDKMKIKDYKIEFNITQKLANIEIEEVFDLSNLVFSVDESLIIESITAKTMTKPTGPIVAELIHRSIDSNGTIKDTSIRQVGISQNELSGMGTLDTDTKYTDGYLVVNIVENGNSHDNLRIIVKIKKTILT